MPLRTLSLATLSLACGCALTTAGAAPDATPDVVAQEDAVDATPDVAHACRWGLGAPFSLGGLSAFDAAALVPMGDRLWVLTRSGASTAAGRALVYHLTITDHAGRALTRPEEVASFPAGGADPWFVSGAAVGSSGRLGVLFTRNAGCSFVEVGEGGRATMPQRSLEPLRCVGLQPHNAGWRYLTYEQRSPQGMAALRTIDRGGVPSPAVAVADDTAAELELSVMFVGDRIAAVRASPDGTVAPGLRLYDGDGGARTPWRDLPFAAGLPRVGVALRSHGAGLLANAISLNVDGGVIVNAALTTDGAEMARLGDFRFAPPTTLWGYTAVRGAAVVATIGVTVAEAIRQGQGTPVALHVLDAVTLREQGMFAIAADVLNLPRAVPVGDNVLLVDRWLAQERPLRAAWLRCEAP